MADNTINVKLKQRIDTESNWSSKNPVLLKGEQGLVEGTSKYKIGDGTTAWNSLPYYQGMSSSDKTKLDGIASGANKYSHPTYTAKSSGLYKVTVDGTGHVSDTTAVTKADITGLGIPASDTNTWRGIQNNLTSDSTTDSLSAAQGKWLNENKTSNKQWTASVKCATWSRLCYVPYKKINTGSSFILNIYAIRGSVVYNDTFAIKIHHSNQALITKLSGSTYGSSIQIRVICDTSGNGYVEIYDTANGATNSTTQTVTCNFIDIAAESITAYTSFTDGTTIPTGFSQGAILKTNTNSLQGNLTWSEITSKPSFATVATSGSYNDLSNKPTIPTVGNGTVTIKQAGANKGTFTMNQSGNTTIELTDSNTTYSTGTTSSSGLTKLYTNTGTATDGTMTQNAIKSALDGKSNTGHTHTIANVTNLQSTLDGKATSAQGAKADTAVQSVKIGSTEYKSGTTVTLPAYPTTLPANGGSATTATKLATARSISLSGGASGSANFDGSANADISVTSLKESYLSWGGKNFSGSYGCIDAAMIPDLGANRMAFGKAAGITVEYSRDSGATWTDYGASDVSKTGLFGIGSDFIIGKADNTNKATADYMLRITVDTDKFEIYTVLNKFAIYVNTNGSNGNYCTIDASLKSTPTTWVNFANKANISGWSGWNIINTSSITTYGNSYGTQYGLLRFTFGCTSGSTTYNGLVVYRIMGFGGVGWNTPSNMARYGTIYSYDNYQNVTFPASVTAVNSFNGSLYGNASSATKLTTSAGSATQPVYFSDGKPVATTYTLGKSVPSDAVFTDTWRGIQNNLTSTSTTDSLSAAQGKVLNDKFGSYVPTSRTVNGKALSGNISLTASDVGASASGHTHNYAGSSSAGGAANSATKLATARTINGVNFDGSANISLTANPTSNVLTTDNLNNITTPGFYYSAGSNTCTNKPSGVDAFGLIVFKTASGYIAQLLMEGNTSINKTWYRQYNAITWSSWEYYYSTTYKPSKSDVGLGNVDNTADSTKSVKYATSAGSATTATTATNLSGFTNTTTAGTAINNAINNGHFYVNGAEDIYGQSDGAALVQAYSSSWVGQIYQDYRTGQIALRGKNNGTWQAWRKVLDSSNYNTYAPTKTGTGASGTWGINVTGSAGSVAWGNVSGKPTTFTPSSHTHGQYYDSGISRTANTVLAAPDGSAGGATFRALTAADIPSLSKSKITDFPTSMPASDVYSWAKASTKPSYSWSEIGSKPSTFTPSSHTHSSFATPGDNRSVATTPNTYSNILSFQGLKTNTVIGSPSSDTYSYLIGLRGWSDASGGNSHELAFNNTGLFYRNGATTSWEAWQRVITSATIGSQSVNYASSAGNASKVNNHTVNADVPSGAKFTDTTYSAATTSANGLMTAAMVTKLNGIAAGANAYSLPTASSSTLGGVKTTSTVTSTSGLTACPIISGVPYYKDTNTTYGVATSSSNGLMSSTDKAKLDSIGSTVTISKTLTVGTDWIDTGISGSNIPSAGSYIVQISGMNASATNMYSEIFTGVMSWYHDVTNSTDSCEIVLHSAGHATNSNTLFLRTLRTADNNYLKLQIASNRTNTSSNYTFKFRKLI